MPDSHDTLPELLSGDPISRRVCRRLAARRRALGLEAALLDLILGLREGTVQRLESGRGRIGPAYLLRLATLPPCRFDVVSVEGAQVQWLRAAFGGGSS